MYQAEPDPYCYPGTTTLINLIDTRDQAELDAFEAEMTSDRANEPLPGGVFDYAHYRAIHHHLFQDVYPWAGEVRTIRIAKGGNWFCYPEYIDREMTKLFAALAAEQYFELLDMEIFAEKATHFFAELNAIHPFREGNGRTQLSFLVALAEHAGHPLDDEKLDPQEILSATVASFNGDEGPLLKVVKKLV